MEISKTEETLSGVFCCTSSKLLHEGTSNSGSSSNLQSCPPFLDEEILKGLSWVAVGGL